MRSTEERNGKRVVGTNLVEPEVLALHPPQEGQIGFHAKQRFNGSTFQRCLSKREQDVERPGVDVETLKL